MKATRRDKRIAGVLTAITAAIFILLPFHALITTWPGSVIGHLDLLRIWKEILIAAMALPAGWLAWRTPELKNWLRRSWLARLIYIYFLLHIVLGWWAFAHHQVNAVALIYALIINLRFLGFFLVCLVVASKNSWLTRHWLPMVLYPGAAVIGFGLVQKFILPADFLKHFGYGPKTIPAYQTVDANIDYRRIQSTLRGANPLGAYLALVLPASIYMGRRLFKIVYLAAGLVALFYTYSRSAWVGFALTLGLLAFWEFKKIPRWTGPVILAVAIVAGGAFYTVRYNQSIQDTFFHTSQSSTSSQSSNAARASAIKAAATDIIHQPLGRGPGTAGPPSTRNNHPARVAENYYLQIGQEVGAAGLIIFVAINYLAAKELWRLRAHVLARLLLASLIGISFVNLLSHAWTDDTLSLIWWGLAGIAFAPAILANKSKHVPKTS